MTKSTKQAIIFYGLATIISIIVEAILNGTVGFIKYETIDGVTSTYTTPAFSYFSMIAMGLFFVATMLSIVVRQRFKLLCKQIKER